MTYLSKKTLVIHSGGMDSSLCLALAIREWGAQNVLSLSFNYQQRLSRELKQAQTICKDWQVDHTELPIDCLSQITHNALVNHDQPIIQPLDGPPNTLVLGRNGLMARLGAIHAESLKAHCIYMGVLEIEEANAGYRDCSRAYMDLMQRILQWDLDDPQFEIRTPLVRMTKKETLECANELGILSYLLMETITCYEGIPHQGCEQCPACRLKNQGIAQFLAKNPDFEMPY